MEEKPVPTFAFHSCFGPSCGHEADQPVSFEMPLKSVPRQRGQSLAVRSDGEVIMPPLNIASSTIRAKENVNTTRRRASDAVFSVNMAAQLTYADWCVNKTGFMSHQEAQSCFFAPFLWLRLLVKL